MKPSDCAESSPYPNKSSGHLFILRAPAKSPGSLGEWHPLDTVCHSLSALLRGALFYYTESLKLCWKSQVLSVCVDILAITPVFNCSPVCVNICVCVRIHAFCLCGCLCVLVVCMHACAHTHTHTEERLNAEVVFFPFYTATGRAHSSSSFPQLFLFYFGVRGERECILIFSASMHRDLFLSSVTGSPTKCPTSPAVIPQLHITSSLPCPPSAQGGRGCVRRLPQPLLAVGALLWVSVHCLAADLHIETQSLGLLPFCQMLMQSASGKKSLLHEIHK